MFIRDGQYRLCELSRHYPPTHGDEQSRPTLYGIRTSNTNDQIHEDQSFIFHHTDTGDDFHGILVAPGEDFISFSRSFDARFAPIVNLGRLETLPRTIVEQTETFP